MNKKIKSPVLRVLILGVIIFVAAYSGMYLGGRINKPANTEAAAEVFKQLSLSPGTIFPDLPLLNRYFDSVSTATVLNPQGTLFYFMDQHCPPCGDLALYYQSLINNGVLQTNQVVGICFSNAGQIEEIYLKYSIDFPILADENYLFMDRYGVDAFPLTVVTNGSGKIQLIEPNSNVRISAGRLKSLFSAE